MKNRYNQKPSKRDQLEAKDCILGVINCMRDKGQKPILQIFIKSVSKSGMSRQMIVILDYCDITFEIKKLLCERLTKKSSITVKGCGMDMAWHLAQTISSELGLLDKIDHYTIY